jgi:hypothetical protein
MDISNHLKFGPRERGVGKLGKNILAYKTQDNALVAEGSQSFALLPQGLEDREWIIALASFSL